ncbi:ATP-binding protein [Desulfovibrio piger]
MQSPGKLPNIVTVENIRETRYSRNPRIARVLAEFGWVRELNEGVKRIYKDMQEFFLDAPVYSEPERTNVCLVLKNNILMRTIRQKNRAEEYIGSSSWNALDDLEKLILTYMSTRKDVTRAELARQTGKSGRTIALRLNNLLSLGLIKRNGHTNDPKQTYSLIFSTE